MPMINVAEARRLAAKRLRSRMGRWAGEWAIEATVFELGLRPPTEREAMGDLEGAETWVRAWRAAESAQGLALDWQSRAWKSVGRQDVPVRLRVHTPEALADFAGGTVAREWSRLSGRAREMRERWPDADAEEFAARVRSVAKRLLDLDDREFDQVLDVVSWLAEHRLGTMRPRQLPIRGVDSKWFGTHRGLVAALLPLAGTASALNILDAEANVRIRILDPANGVGPLHDIAAPVDQLAALEIAPHTVVVVENLETLLSLPDRPGVVAVFGSGYAVGAIARIGWVASARILYWGDLDSHGFAILHQLRSHHPGTRSLLMDEATLLAHRDLWVIEPKPHPGTFSALTGVEMRALERIRAEGHVRLEQERIPWGLALAAVDAALAKG